MKRMLNWLAVLGRCFLTGVLAVLPLAITVAVVVWVSGFVTMVVGPGTLLGGLLQKFGFQFAQNTVVAYVLGLLAVLGFILLLGLFVQMGVTSYVQRKFEALVARVPLMGSIYGTAKQLVGMLEKKDAANLEGMRVVYCIFGQETGAMFLALLPTQEKFHIDGRDYHAVLVPSAPVPVGGSLVFVPVESVKPAELSVDAFMSVYVSMGVTGPQFLPPGGLSGQPPALR